MKAWVVWVVDYVDIIQCHDIEFTSLNQVIDRNAAALREVVQKGKARFVGITGLPLESVQRSAGPR
jgi:L-galactose dehydrogenase